MSESMMCCPLSSSDDGEGDWETLVNEPAARSRRVNMCDECSEQIPMMAAHELCVMRDRSDDERLVSRTCASCVEIRTHFACDGWIFGSLWEDLTENFFPNMKMGGPCQDGLSVAARQRLIAARMEWFEERCGEWLAYYRSANDNDEKLEVLKEWRHEGVGGGSF